jgi:predicted dehydrogenase
VDQTSLRIAVVGAGRAGAARVRAIEASERAQLAGVVRRSGEPTLDGVLADADVDAVIVCTPNLLHAAAIARALAAGKHVAVEFPLASSQAEARALLEQARAVGRVLHVEHIELLAPSQSHLRDAVRGLGPPVGGEVHFQGGCDGWIGEARLAGSPALRCVARLHRLVDLFGPARVRAAQVERGVAGAYRLQVQLAFERGGQLTLVEERGPDLGRSTSWDILCEGGRVEPPPREPPGQLFARDLEVFIERIGRGRDSYVADERILHVLGLVDAIDSH